MALSAAGNRQREVLSFACDPECPIALDADKVSLLADSAVRHGSRATTFTVQGNDLSDGTGVRALAKFVNTNTVLRTLDVSMCRLGNLGACLLTQACVQTRRSSVVSYLTHLNFSLNGIDDEGLLRIGRLLTFSTSCLRVLVLKYNPITLVGLGAFLAVNVPLQLIDVSHCLLEASGASEGGEAAAGLQEMVHGLRRNFRTEGVVAAGAAPWIEPSAVARMFDATKANGRSRLAASIATLAKAVNDCHRRDSESGAAATHEPSTSDRCIREFVSNCFKCNSSLAVTTNNDDNTTPRRSTAEAAALSGFTSPLSSKKIVASGAIATYMSPAPPIEDEDWYEQASVPIPSAEVLEAIAEHDGPIVCMSVRSPLGDQNRAWPTAKARRYSATDVRPVEEQLGVRHDTQAHVDPSALVPSRRLAYLPKHGESSSAAAVATGDGSAKPQSPQTAVVSSVRVRRSLSAATREYQHLYDSDRVPLIGRLSANARQADEQSSVAGGSDVGNDTFATRGSVRTVDGQSEMRRHNQRSSSVGSRSLAAPYSRSSSAVGGSSASIASTSAASSRQGSPARNGAQGRGVRLNITNSERGVAVRKLLGLCAADEHQCAKLLFSQVDATHGPDGASASSSVADVLNSALAPDGNVADVLHLTKPVPPALLAADARPASLLRGKLGSPERIEGLAKLLWCVLYAQSDPVTWVATVPAVCNGMSDNPAHASWMPRKGKPTQSQLVLVYSRKRAEETKARRLVEELASGRKTAAAAANTSTASSAAAGNTSSASTRATAATTHREGGARYRQQSADWVARRRSISTDRDKPVDGPRVMPEFSRGKRVSARA